MLCGIASDIMMIMIVNQKS